MQHKIYNLALTKKTAQKKKDFVKAKSDRVYLLLTIILKIMRRRILR